MRFIVAIACIGLAALPIGCAGRPTGPTKLKPVAEWLDSRYLGRPIVKNSDASRIECQPDFYAYLHDQSAETRREARDRIVNGLMAADDYDFQSYASNAALNQRVAATGADFLVLGLTGAATITGGEQAKTVLSGIAAMVTGGRIAVDKEVFYDTTLPVLLARMQTLRIEKRANIEQKLADHTVKEYPLETALLDLFDYYRAGTLSAAVADIAQETARRGDNPSLAANLGGLPGEIKKLKPVLSVPATDRGTPITFTIVDAYWSGPGFAQLKVKVEADSATAAGRVAREEDVISALLAKLAGSAAPSWGGPLIANNDIRTTLAGPDAVRVEREPTPAHVLLKP